MNLSRLALVLVLALAWPGLAGAQVPNTFDAGVGMIDKSQVNANFKALTSGTAPFQAINGWTPQLGILESSNTGPPVAVGTGYAAGDTITLNDGCTTHATVVVITVSGSNIAGWWPNGRGVCPVAPANPVQQLSTSGTGTGAAFTLNWAPLVAGIQMQIPGVTGGNLFLSNGVQPGLFGTENTFAGLSAAGHLTGNSSFNTAFGLSNCGGGGAANFVGGSLNCFGNDSGRNMAANSNNVDLFGTGTMKTEALGISNVSAFGSNALLNLNVAHQPADLSAFGPSACKGAVGATFVQGVCAGASTGGALTSASHFVIVGHGIGNTTFASGSGVVLIGSGKVAVDTPAGATSNWTNIENAIRVSTVAPTVSSGFGTTPSVVSGTTSAAFTVNVGTGAVASSGVIAFATAAPTGWACNAVDQTNPATANTVATPLSATTVTLTNYSRTTGIAAAWAASDVVVVSCNGY
jgi:hypothetical protein